MASGSSSPGGRSITWLARSGLARSRAAKAVVADLQKQVETKAAAARKAESELAGTKSAAASIASSLEVIAQTDKAKGELNTTLVAELTELRTKSLDAETRLKELEIAFDKSKSDLDVADAARRALGLLGEGRQEQVLDAGKACNACGGKLKRVGEDVTEELEFVPGRFIVNRIVRPRMACSCCEQFQQAALPTRP